MLKSIDTDISLKTSRNVPITPTGICFVPWALQGSYTERKKKRNKYTQWTEKPSSLVRDKLAKKSSTEILFIF